jgi:hypothetical protein
LFGFNAPLNFPTWPGPTSSEKAFMSRLSVFDRRMPSAAMGGMLPSCRWKR